MGDNLQSSIIGRDAEAAEETQAGEAGESQESSGARLSGQLNQTTTEDAGGNVSGTGEAESSDLDIVFEPEEPETNSH